MDRVEKGRRVLDIERIELGRLAERLGKTFDRAVGLMLDALEARGKVVVIGVGKSGHIGEKIAATLTSTGSFAVFLNSLNALHGDLGMVADGDVILALSYSGETEELTNVLPALARFDVRIVSMTGNAGSLLARRSDVHLDVRVEKEACPLQLAPTSSTTAMLALGDALAMVLLEERGFRKEDFARYHPGGRLGLGLLLKVHQIMRSGNQLPIVGLASPVREVLSVMGSRRAGAAIVRGDDGLLAGIFTHGDFVRYFQKDPALGDHPVSGYMTRSPVSIRCDRLAVDVLNLLERHRIDDLVVVDEAGAPIGLVDVQDLTRFKLL